MLPSAHRLFDPDRGLFVLVMSMLLSDRCCQKHLPCVVVEAMCSQALRGSSHTSRADMNCSGLRAPRMSGTLVSSSYRAVATLVSTSLGLAREGLLGAILLRAC
ncbi:hypothetical protein KC325_g30 [Hortaea werneckii]|nr:hypothetical protein KC325_g30 [Hortaea werneckii]